MISFFCLINGMKDKVSFEVKITDRCNARCFHCANEDSLRKRSVIDSSLFVQRLEEWAEAKDRSVAAIREIRMTGGEPLLYPDAVTAIAACATRLGIRSGINTNGIPLDTSTLTRLKSAGLRTIKISFDATDEPTYRKMRDCDSSLEELNRNIRSAVYQGFDVILRFTLCRYNRDQLPGCYRAAREFGAAKFQVKPLIEAGRAAREDAFLTAAEINRALLELATAVGKSGPGVEILCWPPQGPAPFKYKICGNIDKVYFTTKLKAIICNYVPNSRAIGSLRRDSLETILLRRRTREQASHKAYRWIKGCPNSIYFETAE
jgi:MoaA/NifB/PqqE/SkfB family radical SAM enzyme